MTATHARRAALLYVGLAAALLGLAIAALGVGPGDIGVSEAFALLREPPPSTTPAWVVVWELRLPRTLLAAVLGAALGAAGAITQGLFRNPLAEPSVLGVSLGAAAAAVVGFQFGLDRGAVYAIPLLAAAGAIVTLLVLFLLAGRSRDIVTLLLSGVALSSLAAALITVILSTQVERWEVGLKVMAWLMGSFEGRSWPHLAWSAAPLGLGLGLALFLRRDLDVLHLGPDTAVSLGLVLPRTRALAIVAVGLLVGTATALAGVIGFVGLVVPHTARLIVGPGHRHLLAASMLLGAVVVVAVELVTRSLTSVVLPPGVITSLCGGPFFLWLLRRHDRSLTS